jgi:thiamine-phosphate pyrophosphorylase
MPFLSYFITDPKYDLDLIFKAIQTHKPTFVCYRNKEYYDEKEIIIFIDFAKRHSKIFINYDSLKDKTLIKYFDGIHFPSSKLDLIKNYKNKIIISSTHNINEVKKAANSDFITFSPVFDSKGRKGLGIEALNFVCNHHPNVIALGGIVGENEVNLVKNSKAKGFASIRYFLKGLNEKD